MIPRLKVILHGWRYIFRIRYIPSYFYLIPNLSANHRELPPSLRHLMQFANQRCRQTMPLELKGVLPTFQTNSWKLSCKVKTPKILVGRQNQAVRLFRKYLQEKELDPAFKSYNKQTLDKTLCKLYAEARTVDGELYKKSSLRTTRHRLNRYLGNICDADLTQDAEFKESEKVFFSVCTDLKRQCFVDDSDLKKMYQHFDLKNPNSLQRRVFCDIILYFGRRGRGNLRELKTADFNCTSDGDGHKYIYLDKDEKTKRIKMMKIQLPAECMKSEVCNNKI